MTSAGSSVSSSAFATPSAGFDYFATAEHYQRLARGVVDALHRGSLVLLTGDPPACVPMLTEALRKTATPRAVIETSCGPALDFRKLLGGGTAVIGGEVARSAALPAPIYVFADADRLSDVQVEGLLDAAHAAPPEAPALEAGVLVAHSSFSSRLDSPAQHPIKDALAAHLRLQQLERDEIEKFIRYQLPPSGGGNLFTEHHVELIAVSSGGDPAVVNRIARRMIEREPGVTTGGLLTKVPQSWRSRSREAVREESIAQRAASIRGSEIAPPSARWRRLMAIIVSLGVLAMIVGAVGSRDLGGLLRNHAPPQESNSVPATGVPDQVARAVAPPDAAGSSSTGSAAGPPPAAVDAETTAKRAAIDSGQPRATPPSPSAPEAAGSPTQAGPQLSADEIAALLARGDVFLAAGDITSARLFFRRAADAGDGRAAMRMAMTFDAAFRDRAGVHGPRSDPEQAAFWYQRAYDLGEVKTQR
jgi:hypothetical protein